jgi:hypothetical protein
MYLRAYRAAAKAHEEKSAAKFCCTGAGLAGQLRALVVAECSCRIDDKVI